MSDTNSQLTIPEVDLVRREAATRDLQSRFTEIATRCATGRIKVEEQLLTDGQPMLILSFPNGRSTRPVTVAGVRSAERLLETQFERYVVLGDYEAICSYEDRVIEAAIRPLEIRGMPTSYVWRRLFDSDPYAGIENREEFKGIELVAPNGTSEIRIWIGPASRELQVFSYRPDPRRMSTSLRISGIRVNQHDTALEVLEKLSSAVLFELDIKMNLPLGLVRDRRRFTRISRSLAEQSAGTVGLSFPHSEYPQQPMSLYWYARSATGMPLLQYLAYYQALEFFFPIYSQVEAHRRVRNILKDPSFSVHKDTDVNRLLSAVGSGAGRGFGGELAQLRATLQECIDPDELRRFVTESSERIDRFTKGRIPTDKRLPINNPTADLRNDVADRIYDLRCKIVHTKVGEAEGGIELLLPFSREADALDHDIDLVQFIARRVIIASSGPLLLQT